MSRLCPAGCKPVCAPLAWAVRAGGKGHLCLIVLPKGGDEGLGGGGGGGIVCLFVTDPPPEGALFLAHTGQAVSSSLFWMFHNVFNGSLVD